MPGEQIKFRPNTPEPMREEQRAILAMAQKRIADGEVGGEIDHDSEFFLITATLKNGEKVIEHIPKNSGEIPLDKDVKDSVSPEEAIEAVQRFFPGLERPSLKEAVKRLREYKALK